MTNKSKVITALLITVIIVFSTIAYAVSDSQNKQIVKAAVESTSIVLNDNDRLALLSKQYGKSNEELLNLLSQLGTWDKVYLNLYEEKYNNLNSDENIDKYKKKGYSVIDIAKATQLSVVSSIDINSILSAKNENKDVNDADKFNKKNKGIHIINKNQISWDSVIDRLGIDLLRSAWLLGIAEKDINTMRDQGLSQRQIFDIAMLSKIYNLDYTTLRNDYLKSNDTVDILKQYKDHNQNSEEKNGTLKSINKIQVSNAENDDISKTKAQNKKMDEYIKNANQISDNEVEFCIKNGVDKITEIAHIKGIVKKYNTTFENVFRLKAEKGSWDDVEKELGGDGNEK